MKAVIGYLGNYWQQLDKRVFMLSAVFIAAAIGFNYSYGLDDRIGNSGIVYSLLCWFAIFAIAFSFPYTLIAFFKQANPFRHRRFVALLLIAPALFAIKMVLPYKLHLSGFIAANTYWNAVLYYPLKLITVAAGLLIVWKAFDKDQPFYGTGVKGFSAKPYWIMLLIMVPLIAAASTQPDFLAMYPKMQHQSFLSGEGKGLYKLLYELSYGTDFISIEVFFRGFLIIAFARWVGKDAILPMAVFYCTIHFGKPLGECISSFFGGIVLGVVTYHTRTIWGGLMVHLGIAWLMEAGGYIGNIILKQ
jgi:hypothetical protein